MTLLRRTPLCLALALACIAAPALAADDLAAAGLSKQADATAKILAVPSDRAGEAYALVESLTTEIGPRMAGSPNFDRAMEWAKAKFKALGYDRVIAEPVSFTTWERRHESGAIVGANPQPLALTALGGTVGTNGPMEAEVVEFASIDELKAAPAGSLEGKIAFVNKRMERFRDGSGYGPAVKGRGGASEAAAKGAIAYMIRSIGTDSDRMPHTGNQSYAKDAVKHIPAAALSAPDAEQLSRLLKRGPVRVRLDIDVGKGKEYTGYNIIGEITGRGALKNEVVVIGGHLDSWDLGTGAIDDGAGVAITMAAGARIGRLKQAPRRTIRVIAFCNEEAGLFGGKAYAKDHAAELDLQQLGAESDFGAGRIYGFTAGAAPEAEPVIARIASYLAPLGIERIPVAEGGPGPDISPFAKLGMPWAQLAQDGSDYFDYHHTPNDTLDKIDSAALDQQVAAYAVMAYVAAETTVDFGRSPPGATEK